MALIACSRMYNVTEAARLAWDSLFGWVAETSGIDLTVIEHPAPAPLEDLWARSDMGCVFMCGWPFSQADPQPQPIASPIPSAARYRGRAVYFTDFVVRRDRGYRSLPDTFGSRIAWTTESSHSGFNAPRHHLLRFRTAGRRCLYRESIGPMLTPARALACVVEGEADLAPVDSYALELICRHEPERVADLAVIASTEAAPFPPLVATHTVDSVSRERLCRAFLAARRHPKLAAVMADLGLAAFTCVTAADFDITELRARQARAAGYLRPE